MSHEDFFNLLQLFHSFTPRMQKHNFYFQEKKILWVFPDLLFFALCSFTRSAYFTVSGCKKSKFEGICTACIVMIINFVFHKNCPLQIDHACLFSISVSVPLLRCEKSPDLCYSVTFSKSNKLPDLKPPRAWKIIQTTEVSTRSHPNMPTIGPKNCFCEHILSVLNCLTHVMLHIYERFS